MSLPLTNQRLLASAQRGRQVYAVWYLPEAAGQLDSAWAVRRQGWVEVRFVQRARGEHLFWLIGSGFEVCHSSRWPMELGHEIDGLGTVYCFESELAALEWERSRRAAIEHELALMRGAVQATLGGQNA